MVVTVTPIRTMTVKKLGARLTRMELALVVAGLTIAASSLASVTGRMVCASHFLMAFATQALILCAAVTARPTIMNARLTTLDRASLPMVIVGL